MNNVNADPLLKKHMESYILTEVYLNGSVHKTETKWIRGTFDWNTPKTP